MKNIKWWLNEWRHEDAEGRYYLQHIVTVWLSGARYGFCAGIIPVIVWWILR